MKFRIRWVRRFAGFSVASFTRSWMSTIDCKAAFYDHTVDPARDDFQGPAIYVFWHEYILAPFYLRGHCQLAMLLSRHRDADWLAEAADFMGFDVVRGSTFRGGGAALRELTRKAQQSNIAITPDGPRGPRRKLAQGPVFLASRLGIPVVPLGLGYDRPWRMPTWDRFALPRPFSRCRAVVGPKIWLPGDLDRDGVEFYRCRVENLLERFTVEAEAWATSGTGKRDQSPAKPQAAPRRSRWHNRYQLAAEESDSERASSNPAQNLLADRAA